MKKFYLGVGFIITLKTFAATPIINAPDYTYIAPYLAQTNRLVKQLSIAQDTYHQVEGLKGLRQLQNAGNGLCELCNVSDAEVLTNYINQINSDLCSQFSNVMGNLTSSKDIFDNLSQILTYFNKNPAEASVAVQQSSVAILGNIQATMTQMNAMQSQAIQKNLAEEKITNQTANIINQAFGSQRY